MTDEGLLLAGQIQENMNAHFSEVLKKLSSIEVESFLNSLITIKGIARKFIRSEDSMVKKMAIMSLLVVAGMAIFMSLYGAIMTVGFTGDVLNVWIKNIGRNFIEAYPLAVLGGPVVVFVFRKVFPLGTIVEVFNK